MCQVLPYFSVITKVRLKFSENRYEIPFVKSKNNKEYKHTYQNTHEKDSLFKKLLIF